MKIKCSICKGTGINISDKSTCFYCSGYGFDCRNKNEIICPYCGESFRDSWEYSRKMDGSVAVDCQYCYKKFRVEYDCNITYTSIKQD